MVEWGELFTGKSYCAEGDNKFPKSFGIPAKALASGVCTLNFKRKRVVPPAPDNTPTDDASRYALKCLMELETVKDDRYFLPSDPIRRAKIQHHMYHIAHGDFGLSYGTDSKRLYHRVVLMPSEGRQNLKHFYLPLIEYDVKSCHPFFLLSLFTSPEESRRYFHMLIHDDIYTLAGSSAGNINRVKLKKDFMRVMNASYKSEAWLKTKDVFRFFESQFPVFTQSVLSKRTDLAIYLQNLEASMLVQKLGVFCMKNNLFWVPMHDGWISIPGDGDKIQDQASKIISSIIGFDPVFTTHMVNP